MQHLQRKKYRETHLICLICPPASLLQDMSVGLSVRQNKCLFLYLYLFLSQGRIVGLWALFTHNLSFSVSPIPRSPLSYAILTAIVIITKLIKLHHNFHPYCIPNLPPLLYLFIFFYLSFFFSFFLSLFCSFMLPLSLTLSPISS